MKSRTWLHIGVVAVLLLQAVLSVGVMAQAPQTLRLATTTSTADSGLLDFILPEFEAANNAKVDVVAVGTGQSLEIGSKGDADVVLVHSRKGEDQFVKDGNAKERFDVMYNDYILLGPQEDPAKAAGMAVARDAFKAIADTGSTFASRGDKSGTNTKELSIWASAGITPTADLGWYKSLGQGMGETLLFSQESQAYTVSDRGTYLAMKDKLPGLAVIVGGNSIDENKDRNLLNPYGVLAVNPEKHPGVNYELAMKFVNWLLSAETQKKIGGYGSDKFGQPLFYPDSEEYKATREVTVISGGKSKTFSLAELQAMPRTTLTDYEAIGHKKGPLGKNTWLGVSLRDLLLQADPTLSDAANWNKRIHATASDGWKSTLRWDDVFGIAKGGKRLTDSFGCTECHGFDGQGTAAAGKAPVSALAGRQISLELATTVMRTGKPLHGDLNTFTPEQMSDDELAAIMTWFNDIEAPQSGFEADSAKLPVVLAYERNGVAMNGHDGLLQMVHGADKYTSRYAHWVKTIEVK